MSDAVDGADIRLSASFVRSGRFGPQADKIIWGLPLKPCSSDYKAAARILVLRKEREQHGEMAAERQALTAFFARGGAVLPQRWPGGVDGW